MYTHTQTHTQWNIIQLWKEWNNVNGSNMDGHRDYHMKRSQRKTNIIWYHLYVESEKNDTNELIYKTEIDSQT